MEEFLSSVFSFLKRNTSYMGREDSDKAIAKVARQFQPSQKVQPDCLVAVERPHVPNITVACMFSAWYT